MTRPRTRMIKGTDVTRRLLDLHPEGVRLLFVKPDFTHEVATVRGIRPVTKFDDKLEMIVDVDGVSRLHTCLGRTTLDWIQD